MHGDMFNSCADVWLFAFNTPVGPARCMTLVWLTNFFVFASMSLVHFISLLTFREPFLWRFPGVFILHRRRYSPLAGCLEPAGCITT
ncbi:hypothetical protein VTJ04DRAFT_9354 [Mycothermus thermophilus]|uniref:uncharacterized protein n=1 Tax=Humicola insolens TaxID=85995 RepID=UPI003742D702